MVMINGTWEQVKDLSDILKIVSENIGNEFAQKVKEILKEKYDESLESLDYLSEQINELENYINKNDEETDYMRGMKKAFEMIER